MKFYNLKIYEIISYFNETILFIAIEKENTEIIKLLLSNDKIDVNFQGIFNIFNFINKIKNQTIQ